MPRIPDLPSGELRDALVERGWEYLGNARTRLKLDGRVLDLVGVDDPHVNRDRYAAVAGSADPAADLSVGVLHAPYRRVVERMAQAERENAQRDDRADGGQRIGMREGQYKRDGQQPQRRKAIHIRRVAEERVAVAFSPACNRVYGEANAR